MIPSLRRPYIRSMLDLVIAALLLCSSALPADAEEQMTIGAILPLSGQYASLGKYVRRGIELGLEQLPGEGRERLRIVIEDDQMQSALTVAAFQKLLRIDGADAADTSVSPPS